MFDLINLSIIVKLSDNLGRLIERKMVTVEKGLAKFDFSPVDPLVSLHYIHAIAIQEERELSKARASIGLKAEPASDFVSCVWVTSPDNIPAQQSLLKALKKEGVDVIYAYNTGNRSAFVQKSQGISIARANLLSMPYALRIYFSGSPVNMCRKPCLNDPAHRKWIMRNFARQKANFWSHFPYYYSLGDENALSAYNNADICCSEFCNKDFVMFLKEKFGELDKLNACWRKDYASWDEVKPVLLEEARKNNYLIPWFYHRMHMDRVYTDIHDFCKQQIRAFDPTAKVGVEGGLYGSTWGGGDYSQLYRLLDFVVSYESGDANETLNSFCSSDQSYGSFAGAYIPYLANISRNRFSPWRMLLSGGNMGIYWQALGIIPVNGMITGSGVRPDHESYTWFRAFCDDVKEIKKGSATVIRHSKPVRSGAAILYNRLAFYAATVVDRKLNFGSFIKLINDMGTKPEVLTFESILDSSFSPAKYPLLILPGCEYLPQDVADRINVYMAAGGRVICDMYPQMNMQGKELNMDHSRLALFNPKKFERYNGDYGMGGIETFPWTTAGASIRTDFKSLINDIALRRSVEVSDTSGDEAFNCYVVEYENGAERYLGVLRYPYAAVGEKSDFHIKLKKKAFVYDIREKISVGITDAMNITLQPGEAKLLAMSPRPHPDFRLSMLTAYSSLTISLSETFPAKLFFKVEVFSPDGNPVPHYSGNTVVEGSKGEYQIKHALNDAAGEWVIKVTDIVSGNSNIIMYTKK